ncbi:UNVERIFIED_CONTAM: hypothetical protein Sradi_3204100 [Sesamum radiatum]|uniref:Retrotransposon gag domain-containing protein n=1 Tax=Sesamum radiatum TaxID=300843 RepID=A0AAW2RHM0_SESRA
MELTFYLGVDPSKIALGAKMKLGFINGKSRRPYQDFEQWTKADCLVISWLRNSMSKNIVESFLYINTARVLWLELEARFGVSDGAMIYQLQREIASTTQGELSVSAYFSKLKKLWDELSCLVSAPSCTCGASKEITNMRTADNLMQFLMGLNDTFDHVRNQILMMEPLPNATKAYSMVLRVEKQREVNSVFTNSLQNLGMQARSSEQGRDFSTRNNWKKGFQTDKKNQKCGHCGKSEHLREQCF